MSCARDYLELVRAPAVLTVLGDTLAGGSAAGHSLSGRRIVLPLASACLYAGGMALNDYADRGVDAVERPERPIPSGRISAGRALAAASALTAAGLGLSAVGGGRRSLAVGAPLAAAIWSYDLAAKRHAVPAALTMGVCRALDVLMGAGTAHIRAALPAAAAMGGHTVAVTALSRGEVNGTDTTTASGAVAATALVSASVLAGAPRSWQRALPVVAAVSVYAARCAPAQLEAAREPAARHALEATKRGIRAMVPLQAALAFRHGNAAAGLAVAAVDVLGKVLRARSARGANREMSES
ncbi:SCO3242 family prenyltransferase [Zhihengliuella salsuginis]|uniref:Transferase n=1 Tax=Zhihengliuella salsuginis TaxID=578222 RepID=A0ABQ3GG01_9MICC|nr:UbiA family prenyltransferase [Zhihengliuella salsuginis]GHD04814.1 transferase [Zhihengliuella salsuginis]